MLMSDLSGVLSIVTHYIQYYSGRLLITAKTGFLRFYLPLLSLPLLKAIVARPPHKIRLVRDVSTCLITDNYLRGPPIDIS
jgi:hypothetical protein